MRITGTFPEIYAAVRDRFGDSIIDPVVRRENDIWALESSLTPAPDADFECPVDAFDAVFGDAYGDRNWSPTVEDERRFIDEVY